jgi:hypothetical protein
MGRNELGIEGLPQHLRFKGDAFYTDEIKDVMIIGLGGIGSRVLHELCKIATNNYHIFEYDKVEIHNLGSQFYSKPNIGSTKSAASQYLANQFGTIGNWVEYGKYEKDSITNDIVFCGPDNIQCRIDAFNNWETYVNTLSDEDKRKCIFIDGRLSLWQGWVYFVTPDRIDRYKKTLFTVEEESKIQTVCTLKQTSPSAAHIASLMVGYYCMWLRNLHLGDDIYNVPFEKTFNYEQ